MAENGTRFLEAAGNGGVGAADALIGSFHAPPNDAHFGQAGINGIEPASLLAGQAVTGRRFRYHAASLVFLAIIAMSIEPRKSRCNREIREIRERSSGYSPP
jgi:hypothetical protein